MFARNFDGLPKACCGYSLYLDDDLGRTLREPSHANLAAHERANHNFPVEGTFMAARKPKRAKAKSKAAQPKNLFVNSAHQVWLAGLGALSRAQKDGPKVFDSLVAEGEKVHNRTRDAAEEALENAMQGIRGTIDERVEGVRDRASETWDNIEKIFQSRVHKALRQLGVPTAADISALSRKVNELNKNVEALARKRSSSGATEVRSVSLERTKPTQHDA